MTDKFFRSIFFSGVAALCFISFLLLRAANMATKDVTEKMYLAVSDLPRVVDDVQDIKRTMQGFESRFDDLAERLDRLEKKR